MMKQVILVRYGEIILKGLNRSSFEDKLVNNIRKSIDSIGPVKVTRVPGRIFVEPLNDDYDFEAAVNKIIKIFGIVSVSISYKTETNYDLIKELSLQVVSEKLSLSDVKTFKVETKRGNKKFPIPSPQISSEIGSHILKNFSQLSVDVNKPEFYLYVEVRDYSYVYTDIIPAFGGMPTGTNGKAMLLLSGGIDSPVAGFMIGKRGVEIEAIHFYSYPYTSERAKDKVIELAKIISTYTGKVKLHIVPFTELQLEINKQCPEVLLTIIMRRIMMRIAEIVARRNGCSALITGESIGQVASQTMQALYVTDMVADMPVFRPLIGMDKVEVIDIAKKIDTYETSILPYEDCCTVFVAKHPKTRPQLKDVEDAESNLEIDEMINKAIENIEEITLSI